MICYRDIMRSAEELNCLTAMWECEPVIELCQDAIIQTTAGVMVTSRGEVKASTLEDRNKFEIVELGPRNARFLSYRNYYDLIIGNNMIRSIDHPLQELIINIPGNTSAWIEWLSNKTIDLSRKKRNKNLWYPRESRRCHTRMALQRGQSFL